MDVCRVRVARRPMETMNGETRDGSLFLPSSSSLSRRRVLVVESSSSRSRARRRHRAHTHQSHPTRDRSVAVGRGRSRSWADDAGCVSSRDASIDPSIDRTDRTIGARAGRTAARARVGVRTSGRSVGRTFERRTADAWKMNEATRREGRGSRGGMPNPTTVGCRTLHPIYRRARCVVCVSWGMGWGVYGDGDGHRSSRGMVWWCGGD